MRTRRVDHRSNAVLRRLAETTMAGRLTFDEPLSRHASLRIGGPAAVWAEVEALDELEALGQVARQTDTSLTIVGLGSNVLFPDEGIDGIVCRLTGPLAEWSITHREDDDAVVDVGGGVINAHLVRGLHGEGLVGAGFLALIPGTFGGAVALNAGTKERELSEILVDARVMIGDEVEALAPDELALSYRHSELPDEAVVVGGRIRVRPGDVEAAKAAVKADKERRNRTQPYRLASVGSTFANPEDDYAGRLIDEVGLKGERVGGARISELHANFFINEDDATAADFLELMARARVAVRQRFGVELRPEVRFVGFDGRQRMIERERRLEAQEC